MFITKMNLKITLTLRIAKLPPPLYQSLPTSEPHLYNWYYLIQQQQQHFLSLLRVRHHPSINYFHFTKLRKCNIKSSTTAILQSILSGLWRETLYTIYISTVCTKSFWVRSGFLCEFSIWLASCFLLDIGQVAYNFLFRCYKGSLLIRGSQLMNYR